MKHAGCGGEVKADWSLTYTYENDDGTEDEIASLRCSKCGKEIGGDLEIVLDD